ncbi:MAG: LysR family transcriptional regulator [Polyangiaceae bacterium]
MNLLVALDALLTERHVTRAAKRLSLSQSAMSHALGRLRDLTGDPLFVRGGRGLVPTPRALALREPLRHSLERIDRALFDRDAFDPRTSTRKFTIVTSDYAEVVLLPPLLEDLRTRAPGVDVWVKPLGTNEVETALRDETVDLAIVPGRDGESTTTHAEVLLTERFVCVLRKGHPFATKTLTLDRWLSLPHALVAPRGLPGSFVDTALHELGRERRIQVAVPHFLVAPYLVAESDLVLTLAERIARRVAAHLPLVVKPAPIEVPRFTMTMRWPRHKSDDEGHVWFRGALARAAKKG